MAPIVGKALHDLGHAWRELLGRSKYPRKRHTQCRCTLAHGNAALEDKRANLIDHASALRHEALANAVQRLQVELIDRLDRDKLHGRALHCLGNGFGIPEVVLLSLRVGAHVVGWHQSHVMAHLSELPAEMVGSDTGLHADQADRQVGETNLDLAARQLLAQDDGAALVEANEMEDVLADIDPERGNGFGGGVAWHGLAPCSWFTPLAAEVGEAAGPF